MTTSYRAKFDWMVLKPLWLLFIGISVSYFIQGEWLMGVSMVAMNLLLGLAGASLHRKSASELSRGYPHLQDSAAPEIAVVGHEDSNAIGRALFGVGFTIGLAALIISVHHGMHLLLAIPLAMALAWLFPVLFMLGFGLMVRSMRAKSTRMSSDEAQ